MTWKRVPDLATGFEKAGGTVVRVRMGDLGAAIQSEFEQRCRKFFLSEGRPPSPAEQMEIWVDAKESQAMPPRFGRLLASKKKKEQKRLCTGEPMSAAELLKAVLNCAAAGYSYESADFEFVPEERLPTAVEWDAFRQKRGDRDQRRFLKKLVAGANERRRTVVHMFRENAGDYWHALYFTNHDIRGNHWSGPHAHYLSRAIVPTTAADFLARFEQSHWDEQGFHVPWVPGES